MNVNQGGKRPTMKNRLLKCGSINLAESSIAREQALSLSDLLRILINEAFEHHQTIIQKQDGGRSCSQQQINGD
jgi:hypothetical protein